MDPLRVVFIIVVHVYLYFLTDEATTHAFHLVPIDLFQTQPFLHIRFSCFQVSCPAGLLPRRLMKVECQTGIQCVRFYTVYGMQFQAKNMRLQRNPSPMIQA